MSGHPRFTRLASAAAVLLLAGLLQACAAEKAEVVLDPIPPVMGPGTCPTDKDFPTYTERPPDRPGPLVPRDKAVSVTYCVLPTPMSPGPSPNIFDRPAEPPQKLTQRVAEMVEELSSLKQDDRREGRGCNLVGYGEIFSLVVAYENGRQVTVYLNRNCGSAYAEGRDRVSPGNDRSYPVILDKFLARYRDQLATTTDPATVKATACAAEQKAADILTLDGIGLSRGGNRHPFLPNQLVEIRACRYDLTKGALRLIAQHSQRGDLTALRDAINTNMTDEGGEPCLHQMKLAGLDNVTRLDVVWVADATGRSSALWLPRVPCQELRREYRFWGSRGSQPINPILLSQLDAWLKAPA